MCQDPENERPGKWDPSETQSRLGCQDEQRRRSRRRCVAPPGFAFALSLKSSDRALGDSDGAQQTAHTEKSDTCSDLVLLVVSERC